MPFATYRGPASKCRLRATGTLLVRGVTTELTHREADAAAASTADIHVTGQVELEAATVAELKDLAKAVGLPTDGRKADLVDRLADTTSGSPPPTD